MSAVQVIFWDVGGVLLTNAWDHTERAQALAQFQLNPDEFNARHEPLVSPFERGKITLDEYLDHTVFYAPRSFTREAFRDFMFRLSRPFPEVIQFAQALAHSNRYFMGTINNESRELNDYRVRKFGLPDIFRIFVSSCFVGLRKPDPDIYRLAMEITQIPADRCCFIDDRSSNLESAAQLGMHTIQMKGLDQLRSELQKLGVAP